MVRKREKRSRLLRRGRSDALRRRLWFQTIYSGEWFYYGIHALANLTCSTSCQMIEVLVGGGEETETFIIHEPLLTTSSLLFKTRLAAASKDANDTMALELVGISPVIFGSINRYLYTGGIDSLEHSHPPLLPLYPLCDVWLLADHFGMPKLMNYAIWCLVKQLDQRRIYEVGTAIPANLETIYERAPAKSKLRQLLLDMCVWHVQDFKQSIRTPSQMGWDLFETMKVQRRGGNNPLLDVRNYYVKEDKFAQYEARPAIPLANGEAALKAETSVVPPAEPPTTSTQASMPKHHVAEAPSEPAEPVHNSSTPIPQPRTAIIIPPSPVAAVPEPYTKPHEQATADSQTSAQASPPAPPNPVDNIVWNLTVSRASPHNKPCCPQNRPSLPKAKTTQTPTPHSKHCCLHYGTSLNEWIRWCKLPPSLISASTALTPTVLPKTEPASPNDSTYGATPRSSPPPPSVTSCSGTRAQPFEPTNVPERTIHGSMNYQHISAMPAHENFSPEELRLTDYEQLEASLDKLENAYERRKEAAKRESKVEEPEIITISSNSETDTSSEHDQDLPSKVRFHGTWQWRQYFDPALDSPTPPATRKGQKQERFEDMRLTPPPSAQKAKPKTKPKAQLPTEKNGSSGKARAPPRDGGDTRKKEEESEDERPVFVSLNKPLRAKAGDWVKKYGRGHHMYPMKLRAPAQCASH